MRAVKIPDVLGQYLSGSQYEGPIALLQGAVSHVLRDNSTVFFPGYTDHGVDHVEDVLATTLRLVPPEVWNSNLFQPADAAVLIAAVLLHDIGMHMSDEGFAELVSPEREPQPHPWFSEHRGPWTLDRPWSVLWADFQSEMQHASRSKLSAMLGPGETGIPPVAFSEAGSLSPHEWAASDRLAIGEFLRRHHGRVAFETATHGFPATSSPDFPVLSEHIPDLAPAIGLTARSHQESLRSAIELLRYLQGSSLRPFGALIPYHMSLLRVADYVQLEHERAPRVLLKLKQPLSPISIEEWHKHAAVANISWDHRDPKAIYLNVSPRHSLRVHLALQNLFAGLVAELDTTNAVLSELYGRGELMPLALTKHRIATNLTAPSLTRELPYVPRRARLKSGTDLFRLLVGNVYGKRPDVAGRELIQNAVDAVRELRRDAISTGLEDDLTAEDGQIKVALRQLTSTSYVLVVSDRGIGMTPDTVIDYFLTAGASFGAPPGTYARLSRSEAAQTVKAGRFGVGAHAAFLLGPTMKVATRHAAYTRGLVCTVRSDSDELVELTWADMPRGTTIEVPFELAEETPEMFLTRVRSWYALREPTVTFGIEGPLPRDATAHNGEGLHVRKRRATGTTGLLVAPEYAAPTPGKELPPEWRSVEVQGFEGVWWRAVPDTREEPRPASTAERRGKLALNGLWIAERPWEINSDASCAYSWSHVVGVREPHLAVADTRGQLTTTLDRYRLLSRVVPFESELIFSIGEDLVAHGLAFGPRKYPLGLGYFTAPVLSSDGWVPLLPDVLAAAGFERVLVLWDSDATDTEAAVLASSACPAWLRLETQSSPIQLQGAVRRLARATGARSHASVVTFRLEDEKPPPRRGRRVNRRPARYGHWRRAGGKKRRQADGQGLWSDVTRQGSMGRELIDWLVSQAKSRVDDDNLVVVTLLTDFAGSDTLLLASDRPHVPSLGEAWQEIVGTTLDSATSDNLVERWTPGQAGIQAWTAPQA